MNSVRAHASAIASVQSRTAVAMAAFAPPAGPISVFRGAPIAGVAVCRRAAGAGTRMQTVSTQDYMEFLSSTTPGVSDCRSTVVGARGRLGNFILSCGDGTDVALSRGQRIPFDAPGPIYVCTRNEDLAYIIRGCPPLKRDNLVFLQNGFIEPLLLINGLERNTRANIYFAVPEVGADPVDGKTELDPDGLTAVCGRWAGSVRHRLSIGGMSCKVQSEEEFRRGMLEKLIWISAFNLIGALHGGITVGEVADKYEEKVLELIREMVGIIRVGLDVDMGPEVEQRLLAYARSVKDMPTAMKEFDWRNGYFYKRSQLAWRMSEPDPAPVHSKYIEHCIATRMITWG